MFQMHHQRLHEQYNRMMWETIPDHSDTDQSFQNDRHVTSSRDVPSGQEEAVQIFPPSSGLVQQGYDSMANLTAADIFGNRTENASHDRKWSKKPSHEPTTQPFLSVPADMPTDVGDGLALDDHKTVSESDVHSQDYNTAQSSYEVSDCNQGNAKYEI